DACRTVPTRSRASSTRRGTTAHRSSCSTIAAPHRNRRRVGSRSADRGDASVRAGQHARVAAPPPADAIDVTPSNAALTRSRSNPAGVWAARACLLIGALCGLALALVTPPLRWGDENTHLIQAYRLSELNFTLLPAMKATRVELPRGVGKLLLTRSLELERKRHKGPESLKALRRKLAIEARSN